MIFDGTCFVSHVTISPDSGAITKGFFVNFKDGVVGVGSSFGGRPFGISTGNFTYDPSNPDKKISIIVAGDSPEDDSYSFISGQNIWSNVDGEITSSFSQTPPSSSWRRVGLATFENRFVINSNLELTSVF